MSQLTVIDLFCGAGGFSEGFKQAGFKIVEGYDLWVDALTSFHLNHDCGYIKCDLLKKAPHFFPKVDVVIGSPPCVDFSTANPKADFRDGLKLVFKFLEVVCHLKPKYWVMENVPQVGEYLPTKLASAKTTLNSADFGVAQIRRRCFFGNYPKALIRPTHAQHNTLDGLKRWKHAKIALDAIGTKDEVAKRYLLPRTPSREKMINDDVLNLDKPSPTITCKQDRKPTFLLQFGRWYRFLTPLETQILMGFPVEYKFYGGDQSKYRQIGNAVCPPVAHAIAKAIMEEVGKHGGDKTDG